MTDTLTKYIAENTMGLKERNSCLSFISLIWRDRATIIMFNNLNNTIMSSFTDIQYQENDIEVLEELITNFLN